MNKAIIIILLSILCLFCYFNSLSGGFIFDDKALILNNHYLKSSVLPSGILKEDIYRHWVGKASFGLMYRPIQIFSYWLDCRIYGLIPMGLRLTNLFLHLLNGILIYLLILRLFSDPRLAAFTAALFIAHPLNLPVVAYISGRADLLSLFFMLLSAYLFARGRYLLRGSSSGNTIFASCSRNAFRKATKPTLSI